MSFAVIGMNLDMVTRTIFVFRFCKLGKSFTGKKFWNAK